MRFTDGSLNRRRLLGNLSVMGAISLAGCPTTCIDSGTSALLAVEKVDSVPAGEQSVDLEKYSEDSQSLIRRAIRDGDIAACSNGILEDDPETVKAIGVAGSEASNHGPYVRDQGSNYALTIYSGDQGYAEAAETTTENPCCVGYKG